MNKKTIIYSIKSALPVMTGYIVLSIGFGLLLQDGSLTVVSNFSLTKSLKTLIISMLLSFFIVKFVKIIVLI